jgi:hypothetical protein
VGAVYLLRTQQVRFKRGGNLTQTMRRRVQVLDTAAVETFSTLEHKFDPLSERVFINELRVTEADGTLVAEGKVEDQYVTDPSLNGPATLGRVLCAPVPGLKPGRILEFTITIEDSYKNPLMRLVQLWLYGRYPCAAEAVVVEGDLETIQAEPNATLAKLTKPELTAKHWIWLLPQPAYIHSEAYLPRLDTFMPMLALGNKGGEWRSVGEEYLKMIVDPLKPEPAIDELAQKLTAGLTTEEEKIHALSKHVREELKYKAIEFGRRGRVPNAPSRVAANHYGDCKDMSLFLHSLLRAVKIPSHLTLIHSYQDLSPSLPDLDQFNHAILYVPSLKAQFIDCTEGRNGTPNLPPQLFQRQAFVIDPANPRLISMPERKDWSANQIRSQRTVQLESDGSAEIEETLTYEGYQALWMRNYFRSQEPEKRLDNMQAYHQRACHWQLDKLEVVGLLQPREPLVVKMRYALPPPIQQGSAQQFMLPAVFEHEILDTTYMKNRYHPFEWQHPYAITSEVRVIAPRPIDPSSLASMQRGAEGEFIRYQFSATPRECVIQFQAQNSTFNQPAGRYAEMYQQCRVAAGAWNVPLRMVE